VPRQLAKNRDFTYCPDFGEQTAQACAKRLFTTSMSRYGGCRMISLMVHRWVARVALFALPLFTLVVLSEASDKPTRFVLRATDTWITESATAGPNNIDNCVLVLPDGHFYLSLRRQEIMDGTATLKTLEGSIDGNSLQILIGLLNRDAIRNAPPFERPNAPFGADEFQSFEAQIQRGATLQQVGYFKWKGRGPDNPDLTKKQWQESELAL
jgi:hypothetical protein